MRSECNIMTINRNSIWSMCKIVTHILHASIINIVLIIAQRMSHLHCIVLVFQ